ncbi:hypothetical protein BDR26DRAFT_852138 [Obelidium mucronatum]|nr:hypothetical protein BDR26DRAFT_852138 [Obelidium mucronatum]
MHPVRGSFYLEVPSAPQPPTPPPPPTVPAASPPAAQSPAPPAVTTTVASTSETSTTSSSGSAATGASGTSAMGGGEFCYDTKNTFCVSGTKDNVKNTIEFTVTSTAKGWASIGTGQYMDKSTMFIGWKNGNDVIISQRRGQGHDQPITSSPPVFTKLTNTKNNATLLSFTFSVPVSNSSSSLISLSGANSFIFGLSDSAPSNPSDAATPSIPQHSLYGSFSMDFSKATVTSTVGIAPIDGRLTLLLIHGVAMFLAWAVVPPIAIFVARYLKEKWGHRWYLTHTALLVFGTGGLMVISLITVELQLAPGVTRFIGSSNHGILGTIVALVLYPLQCGLGWLSNKWFDPDRKAVPWWDQLHWWVGRSVVLLGIVNIHLGIVEYGGWVPWVTAFWIYIALVLVVGFWYFGEKRMGGVVHHIGKSEEGTEEIKL